MGSVTMMTVNKNQGALVPVVTMCLMTPMVSAGSAYWWMGESGSFGGGGNDNGVGYGQQSQSQPQKIHNQPNVPHNSGGSGSNNFISNNNINNNPNSGYDLPSTECAVGYKCVSELFCDQTGTMVSYRVDLTDQQKKQRGQLVPCMNQALGKFEVCCRKPASFDSPRNPQQESQPQQQFQQQQPQLQQQPQYQQQQQPPNSACPAVTSLPAVSSCAGKKSNCWSVGQTDVDCLDNALCCFDGCANVCQGRGPIAGNPGPSQNPVRQPQPVVTPQVPAQVNPAPPLPVTQPVYQPQNQGQYPVQSPPQKPKKQNKKPAKVFSPQPQRQQSSSAEQQPFIQCPSAMKCVPKINCDFNGVMVNYEVRLNRVQEEGRVPLIPCFNQRGNSVDVCCRDPNYKDPWPDVNNGNGNFNGNNNNNRKKNHNKQNKQKQQQQFQVSNGNIRNGYGK